MNQGRFTACGFKRLETEAFLRESAARWADSRNVIRIIQLYKAIGGRKEKEIKMEKKKSLNHNTASWWQKEIIYAKYSKVEL